MKSVELLGFAFFGLNVAGNLMLTSRSLKGWYVRLAANVFQILYAVGIGSASHELNGATFLLINCVGIYRWRLVLAGHDGRCSRLRFRRVCNCGREA